MSEEIDYRSSYNLCLKEHFELKAKIEELEFHNRGLERQYLEDAIRIKELEENNAELDRIIGDSPSQLGGEEKEFRISIDKIKEEYVKALLEHRNNPRYLSHLVELELEVLLSEGELYVTFECKAKTNSVAMDHECEFVWVLFTTDEEYKELN